MLCEIGPAVTFAARYRSRSRTTGQSSRPREAGNLLRGQEDRQLTGGVRSAVNTPALTYKSRGEARRAQSPQAGGRDGCVQGAMQWCTARMTRLGVATGRANRRDVRPSERSRNQGGSVRQRPEYRRDRFRRLLFLEPVALGPLDLFASGKAATSSAFGCWVVRRPPVRGSR